ncbi:MAG: FAD-dependent oxidoreductase [Candidatus Brocadiia bacterium]
MPEKMTRRRFLRSSAAGAAALGTALHAANEETPTMETYREPAREVPVAEQADVVVAGAGPAGVAAAIAAARAGAVTRLLEANGCLGGTWTAGLLSWILDSGNKRGLVQEIIRALDQRSAAARYGGSVAYDPETMKLLLEQVCQEAGVRAQLHTRVVAAVRGEGRRLALALTESKSGRQAWAAKAFVDATGDGDLAAQAGCRFAYGREGTAEAQPMSLVALVTGIRPDAVAECVRGLAEPRGERDPKGRLREAMQRGGAEPSYASPTLFYIRDGLFCLMANHQYRVAPTDAADLTRATMEARAEIHRLVDALRSLQGPWKDLRLVATAEHIGVREGRRIRGLYEITSDDLAQGARHDDAVCRCRFPVDVHSTDPERTKGIQRERVRARPYDIPYRALVARDVEGLLLAGRCISGDFIAHSSYRVTGEAVPMGEAAGVAAALAASTGRSPRELPWPEVQERLDAVRARRAPA